MATLAKLQETLNEAGFKVLHHPGDEKTHAEVTQSFFHWSQSKGWEGGYFGQTEAPQNFSAKDPEKEQFSAVGKFLIGKGFTGSKESKTPDGGVLKTFFKYAGDYERPWVKVVHDHGRVMVSFMKGSGKGMEEIPDLPRYSGPEVNRNY